MAKANSPEEGMANLIRNQEANTGKSINAWIATARPTGQTKHGPTRSSHARNFGDLIDLWKSRRASTLPEAPKLGAWPIIRAVTSGAPSNLMWEKFLPARTCPWR